MKTRQRKHFPSIYIYIHSYFHGRKQYQQIKFLYQQKKYIIFDYKIQRGNLFKKYKILEIKKYSNLIKTYIRINLVDSNKKINNYT